MLQGGGSVDGSPSDTASSISSPSAKDTTPPLNLKQTHAHQTSIHPNPTASYGLYSPGFCSTISHTPPHRPSLWVLDYDFIALTVEFSQVLMLPFLEIWIINNTTLLGMECYFNTL